MPFCDVCKRYYHLSCLDPPLTKMPKTTRYYGWTCSDCVEKLEGSGTSGDEEPPVEKSPEASRQSSIDENDSISTRRSRRSSNKIVKDEGSVPLRKRHSAVMIPVIQKKSRHSNSGTASPEKNTSNTSAILEMCLQAEQSQTSVPDSSIPRLIPQ